MPLILLFKKPFAVLYAEIVVSREVEFWGGIAFQPPHDLFLGSQDLNGNVLRADPLRGLGQFPKTSR